MFRRPAFHQWLTVCRVFLEWTYKTRGLLPHISALKPLSILFRTIVRVCSCCGVWWIGTFALEQLLMEKMRLAFFFAEFAEFHRFVRGKWFILHLLEGALHVFRNNFCLAMIKLVFCDSLRVWMFTLAILLLHNIVEYGLLYLIAAVWEYYV